MARILGYSLALITMVGCRGSDTCVGGSCGSGAACTSEPDAAFCIRLGKQCGSVTAQDNCGVERTVGSCGTCTAVTATCSANNVCISSVASGCSSTLSGGSVTTMTLVEANSPYCVNGDLVVPKGSRFTIEPGVILDFQGHYSLTIKGHLTAMGTADKRITFTSSKNSNWPATSGDGRGWNGLRFYPYADPSEIDDDWVEYCDFSYANKGGNQDSDPVATYIDSLGGAVYLAGRPSSMGGPLNAVTQRFHFNHNRLVQNAASKSGGGFGIIQETCMNPGNGASCVGGTGYFLAVFEDNYFESNRCNLQGGFYGAGGWAQFHCCYYQDSSITIQGGSFVNNGCEQGQGDATNVTTQVGGIDGGITLLDVSVSPIPSKWIWNSNSDNTLKGTTPPSN
jgi:hypothetical protein